MNKRKSDGFTIVELLLVIGIVAVLAGIVLGVAGLANEKAANARARTLLEKIKLGLEAYRTEYGLYPQVEYFELDNAFTNVPPGHRVFMELDPDDREFDADANELAFVDPWGSLIHYEGIDPVNNPDSYDLASWGPDAVENTEDDITNWKR